MTILEHPDAQALLDDAILSPEQLLELAERLQPFLQRYAPCFRRREQRQHAHDLLTGKLSALSRKTAEPIAHHLGQPREPLQDFLGSSPWSDRAVLDTLRRDVVERWGDPKGVLNLDGSAFAKKGDHSCGVKRQYCGRLGKTENCQLGVFLSYVTRHGHTLLEPQLFLPPDWVNDPQRRQDTGVPKGIMYQETWQIALAELDCCRQEVPHAWVAADAEFGRVNAFRAALRDRHERYVLDVRDDLRFRDLQAPPPPRRSTRGPAPSVPLPTNAQTWTHAQPETAWQRFEIRGGDKGPLVVEAVQTQVATFEEGCVGPQERFVAIRTVGTATPNLWYTLSNAPALVPLADVVWAHAQRYWEEDDFKSGKSEIGLGQYEVRGWLGWHHHMTLSLLALWFLVSERARVRQDTPAITVSVLREALSRLWWLQHLTLTQILAELNATLRRKEEARIYHWQQTAARYPPRRVSEAATTAQPLGTGLPDPMLNLNPLQ